MDSLHEWFKNTNKAISESKYFSREIFWKTASKVFSGKCTPEEEAKIIEEDMRKNILNNIEKEIMNKIKKGEI
jgi:hypothetical protein